MGWGERHRPSSEMMAPPPRDPISEPAPMPVSLRPAEPSVAHAERGAETLGRVAPRRRSRLGRLVRGALGLLIGFCVGIVAGLAAYAAVWARERRYE